MFKLFPDQITFIEDIRNELKIHDRVICCAATGFGKSKVFITISNNAISKGKTVLILTESSKIFNQISKEVNAELIDPDNHHEYIKPNKVYIAMTQTLNNRDELIKQFKESCKNLIVIVDECHMGHFNKVLEKIYLNCILLGFTATPDARWAKHLPIFYQSIVIGPQPHELILNGRLVGCRHFARVGADLKKLVIGSNGDFTEASQQAAFQNSKVFDGLIEDLNKFKYDKCMIYTASIDHCNAVADVLNSRGLKCVALHKNNNKYKLSKKQYNYRLACFHPESVDVIPPLEDQVDIAVSVGTMTKGYDYDRINLLALDRATTSLPLYLQMDGRGGRVLAGEFGLPIELKKKKNFTILDYGGNYLRFGLWDSEREWADLWNKPKKSKDGVAPVKFCPQCEEICAVSAVICSTCGYIYEKKDIPLEVGEMIEVTELYSKMVQDKKRIGDLSPLELSIYAKMKNKKQFAMRVARSLHNEQNNYLYDYAKHMGYDGGWIDWQLRSLIEHSVEIGFTNFILL